MLDFPFPILICTTNLIMGLLDLDLNLGFLGGGKELGIA